MNLKAIAAATAMLATAATAGAQAMYFETAKVKDGDHTPDAAPSPKEIVAQVMADTTIVPDIALQAEEALDLMPDSTFFRVRDIAELDAYLDSIRYLPHDTVMGTLPLPQYFFLPTVFDHYRFPTESNPFKRDLSGKPEMRWFEEYGALSRNMNDIKYNLFSNYPGRVAYNIDLLPEAPKQYVAEVDPSAHTIELRELDTAKGVGPTFQAPKVKKKHWIRSFNALLQFSQAYVSPNWYQGGNNNVNVLANMVYNVKLNTQYHPNLLFETTAQYKLGMNNAPNDTVHNYNISDDIFQVNTNFGVKAARRWYYSFTGQFKTQLLNSYKTNSHNLRSAFLSPGELTVGLGMTYNYSNPKKTFTFDLSLAPLSYNMKTCISHHINPANYNIKDGRRTQNNFGSSGEMRMTWKIAYNITLNSRIFAFTNYDSAQIDWENTLNFSINRFLTTQIYAHARYDTATRPCDDPSWKKLQVKEILSIGFSYKFSSI